MRLKKAALATLVCMACASFGASAAQAAPHWNINGSPLSGSETVSFSGGPWALNSTTLGTEVELTATGIGCASTCTISGAGESAGSLKFSGVAVKVPASCTAGNPGKAVGTLTTNALRGQMIMDPHIIIGGGPGPVFDKFTPASGTTFVEVEFHGALCVLDELALVLEGSAGGQSQNATAVEKVEQVLSFGPTQQFTSNAQLKFGGSEAVLRGTAVNTLSGIYKGQSFSATE